MFRDLRARSVPVYLLILASSSDFTEHFPLQPDMLQSTINENYRAATRSQLAKLLVFLHWRLHHKYCLGKVKNRKVPRMNIFTTWKRRERDAEKCRRWLQQNKSLCKIDPTLEEDRKHLDTYAEHQRRAAESTKTSRLVAEYFTERHSSILYEGTLRPTAYSGPDGNYKEDYECPICWLQAMIIMVLDAKKQK